MASSLPTTSTPPATTTGCDPTDCSSGTPACVLFGPGRTSLTSHTFTVTDTPIIVRGCRLGEQGTVTIQHVVKACNQVCYENVRLCDMVLQINCETNFIVICESGEYRAVLADAEPDEALVVYAEQECA